MKSRILVVVGSAHNQSKIAALLPECQITSYEGFSLNHNGDRTPDAFILFCEDGLIGKPFEVAWRHRFDPWMIFLINDRWPQRVNQIGQILKWPIAIRSIQSCKLRAALSLGQKNTQDIPLF